jgi:phage/conjugal plasmid C-4 type zinc finger TraR family protein
MGDERFFELAELRAGEERNAGIATVAAMVARPGSDNCADCGEEIPTARKAAAPFARRCVDCQTFHEEEKLHR